MTEIANNFNIIYRKKTISIHRELAMLMKYSKKTLSNLHENLLTNIIIEYKLTYKITGLTTIFARGKMFKQENIPIPYSYSTSI